MRTTHSLPFRVSWCWSCSSQKTQVRSVANETCFLLTEYREIIIKIISIYILWMYIYIYYCECNVVLSIIIGNVLFRNTFVITVDVLSREKSYQQRLKFERRPVFYEMCIVIEAPLVAFVLQNQRFLLHITWSK